MRLPVRSLFVLGELEDLDRGVICYPLSPTSTVTDFKVANNSILDFGVIHGRARAIISVPVLNLRHEISKNLPADELTTPSGARFSIFRKSMTLGEGAAYQKQVF